MAWWRNNRVWWRDGVIDRRLSLDHGVLNIYSERHALDCLMTWLAWWAQKLRCDGVMAPEDGVMSWLYLFWGVMKKWKNGRDGVITKKSGVISRKINAWWRDRDPPWRALIKCQRFWNVISYHDTTTRLQPQPSCMFRDRSIFMGIRDREICNGTTGYFGPSVGRGHRLFWGLTLRGHRLF